MKLSEYKEKIAPSAKDIRLNLGAVLSEEGAPGLSPPQIAGIALTSAYTVEDSELVSAVQNEYAHILTDKEVQAAQIAASLMAMNNVYYRFVHFSEDPDLKKLPAKLRMTAMSNPGVEKGDFELYSLAASAINGCERCVQAHIRESKKSSSIEAIQSTGRIASVIRAAKLARSFSN